MKKKMNNSVEDEKIIAEEIAFKKCMIVRKMNLDRRKALQNKKEADQKEETVETGNKENIPPKNIEE